MNPPRVLITLKLDAVGPTRLPALFHRAGYHVTLLCRAGLAIASSRFVNEWIEGPADRDQLLDALRMLVNENEYDWVVIASEPLLLKLSGRAAEPWAQRIMPSTIPVEAAELFQYKLSLLDRVREQVVVPKLVCAQSIDAMRAAATELGFPLILRGDVSMAGSGVARVQASEDLDREYARLNCLPIAVQQFVPGPVGNTDVLFYQGQPVCWFSSYAYDFWPNPLAASCARWFVDHQDVEIMLNAVGKATGFHGLAGIDWIHDPGTDRMNFLELNPRPTPGYHLGPRCGVDFSKALRQMAIGAPEIQRPRKPSKTLQYMFPEGAYRAIQARRPGVLLNAIRDVCWTDPGLLSAHLRRLITHHIPSNFRTTLRTALRGTS